MRMFHASKRFFFQILKVVACVCLAALAVGWVYEKSAASRDNRRYQPPGTLVKVHGHWMHLNCMGSGSPTVVLDSALGFHSLDWSSIQKQLAHQTHVCTFDRPGYGWSAAVPGARTSFDAAYELHDLLKAAGEEPPFILVGHAYGALTMQFYANLYPEEVAGLVLLDPLNEEMIELLPRTRDLAVQKVWDQVSLLFAKTGIHRYLSRHVVAKNFPDLAPEVREPFQAQYSRPQTLETAYRENLGLIESLRLLKDVRRPFDGPITVISSGRESFMEKSGDEELYDKIVAIHKNLAQGQHTVIEESGHFIHHDEPEAVVEAVRRMLR